MKINETGISNKEVSQKKQHKKEHKYPPPPPNANVINPNVPPVDTICKPITFNFINPIVKKI